MTDDRESNHEGIEKASGANECELLEEGEADWIATYAASAGLSGIVSLSTSNSKGLGTIQGLIRHS
jgi:hypothetical protein